MFMVQALNEPVYIKQTGLKLQYIKLFIQTVLKLFSCFYLFGEVMSVTINRWKCFKCL